MRLTKLVRVVPINSGIHEKIIWYAMASNVGVVLASTTPLRAAHSRGRTFIVATVAGLAMCHHAASPKEKDPESQALNVLANLLWHVEMKNNEEAFGEDDETAAAQKGHADGDHRHHEVQGHGQVHVNVHSTW